MMSGKSKGTTLIEVMVVTVLASMVLGSAMGIWSFARRNMSRTATRQTLQQDTTRILTHLGADLKAAKGQTFSSTNDPLTLEFTRYAVNPDDNDKLSSEITQRIKYEFKKPVLRRYVDNRLKNTLSYSVENINISRKELSAEEKEKDPYLEARVDIALEMGQRAPGTTSDEHFTKHTSVVIRDEFYALVNKDRSDVFEEAADVAVEIVRENDSSFFADALDADSLKSLTDEQLDDLEESQKVDLEEAIKGLDEINKQIDKVETGDGFFNMWWWKNEDAEDVEELKGELEDLEYEKNFWSGELQVPPKDSGERCSDKANDIIEKLEDKVKTLDKTFMQAAFGSNYADPESEDQAAKDLADLQKRAFDMRVADRQVEKAIEEMSEEERTQAEADGSIPKKMIDYYIRSETEIREEIRSSGLAEEGTDEFNRLVAQEVQKVDDLKEQYDRVSLEAFDDGTIEEKTVKAYEAAKQLKGLAESKRETFKLIELAVDNLAEIDEARELKKEELVDSQ